MTISTDPVPVEHVKKESAAPEKKSAAEKTRPGGDRVTFSRTDMPRILEENRTAAHSHIEDVKQAEAVLHRLVGTLGKDPGGAADVHQADTRRALFLSIS
jgi:hypothetical protein